MISFDHIHLISRDPQATAQWYVEMLGGEIAATYTVRDAPQIAVRLGGMTLLVRGERPGEEPVAARPMRDFTGYSSHDAWGTDHFGFTYEGDLREFCEALRAKGAEFAVEPWEFTPGNVLCYLAGPDGVSIELVQKRAE